MRGGSIFGWRMLVGIGVTLGWRTNAGVLVRWGLDGFYCTEFV
jgi:hypothetical protein